MRRERRLECSEMDELIDALAGTPKALAQLVADASDELLDESVEGGWSARTILAHFRDDEFLCTRVALERMLAEREPELLFIDGADWEPGRNRTRDRKPWLLGDFALQRQASISILRLMRPEDWQRSGRSGGREFSIERFVRRWVEHDREHVAELERLMGETADEAQTRRARID